MKYFILVVIIASFLVNFSCCYNNETNVRTKSRLYTLIYEDPMGVTTAGPLFIFQDDQGFYYFVLRTPYYMNLLLEEELRDLEKHFLDSNHELQFDLEFYSEEDIQQSREYYSTLKDGDYEILEIGDSYILELKKIDQPENVKPRQTVWGWRYEPEPDLDYLGIDFIRDNELVVDLYMSPQIFEKHVLKTARVE